MSTAEPDDLDRIDREIRINELKHEADELTDGTMASWESEDCPPDIAESFWRRVVDYEKAPWTSLFEQLTLAGFDLPDPGELDDRQVSAVLSTLIARLAETSNYLSNTDHLSDRDLYERLWDETLHERMKLMPKDEGTYHIDMVGSGSEEDIELYLRYYADEKWRQEWVSSFPDSVLPPREKPPYDRDRHLPKPPQEC
jgi:hypothetical protein